MEKKSASVGKEVNKFVGSVKVTPPAPKKTKKGKKGGK